ncbi:MAG TPA: hypothetical protein VIR60_04960 [Gammaproteobacteria bacterium]
MQNPDTTDPQWIEARERLWQRYAEFLSEELSRKQIACIKPMYFEPEFDYGNPKYGEFRHDYQLAIRLCPIQTPERWRRYLLEDAPRWRGKEYDLAWEMLYLVAFDDDHMFPLWGIDAATEVELAKYVLGERFIRGSYEFSGVTVPYPVTANYVHDCFIRHIFGWLRGGNPREDVKWRHFIEYWRNALPCVNSVYFKYKMSRSGARFAQYCLQRILMYIRDYDVEEVKQHQLSDEDPVIVQDSGLRKQTADAFKDMLDNDRSLPAGLRDLWKMAQSPDFSPSPYDDEYCLDPSEDVPNGFTHFDS